MVDLSGLGLVIVVGLAAIIGALAALVGWLCERRR